jgi:hypothetical protein
MAWYDMVWYGMVWFGLVWFGLVWTVSFNFNNCGLQLLLLALPLHPKQLCRTPVQNFKRKNDKGEEAVVFEDATF